MYRVIYAMVYAVFKVIYRMKIIGKENRPKRCEGTIVCGNHTGYTDPVFAALALGVQGNNCFMAKASLFKNKALAWLIRKLGAFPITRGTADIGAIKTALRSLKEGKHLIMFPEGTRVKQGAQDAEAQAGAGMLALRSGCKVLPIYITPYKKFFIKKTRVILGKPYFVTLPEGMEKSGESYMTISREIMERVNALGNFAGEAR